MRKFKEAVPAQINPIAHLDWEIQVELLLRLGHIVNAHLNCEGGGKLQFASCQQVLREAEAGQNVSRRCLQLNDVSFSW
ncbi:MAG: hypothetical protein F6K28_50070 [Microcoleus sp. SIO2G3]|nr:hypothetical protein [Microcoleus sp. SIO2G3]